MGRAKSLRRAGGDGNATDPQERAFRVKGANQMEGPDLATLVSGTSGPDTLVGTGGDDQLRGLAGNDRLDGLGGNDLLDGGSGDDALYGGTGDDVYYIDSAGDRAVEIAYEGFDTLYTSVSFTADPDGEIENFFALDPAGTSALDISANRFDNLIRGNEGPNILSAGLGDDILYGFGGNDTLSAGDGVDTLYGGSGDDHLIGGDGFDIMYGGAGNDVFDATSSRQYGDKNRMYGEAGNDTYYVDRSGDLVFEIAGQGYDTIYTVFSYRLQAANEVEALVGTGPLVLELVGNELPNRIYGPDTGALLSGLEGDDAFVGGAGDDTFDGGTGSDGVLYSNAAAAVTVDLAITTAQDTGGGGTDTLIGIENLLGSAYADVLSGDAGANWLDGGPGADRMSGGDGDDLYVVDNGGDRAIEASAGGGLDTVRSSVTFTLGANVENLTLISTRAIDGTGNALANVITGNAAANRLDGGAGADTLSGGGGNDVYVVDIEGDRVVEAAGAGSDAVQSAVSFTLGANVENLTLTGTGAVNGTGNGLANSILGNGAANLLRGGGGQDRLQGGGGADSFQFDSAPGAANLDHIVDFAHGADRILLDNAAFTGLADGALAPGAFALGSHATAPGQRILYDAATGILYFDPDGSGAAAALAFAILDNRPATLTASDFAVI